MIVVADTSVILNLALVGRDGLLRELFGKVTIPPAVRSEFNRLAGSSGRFAGLKVPAWLNEQLPASIPPVIASDEDLDSGECQALALALELHADAVLIDEAHGRSIASSLGLTPIGVLGILVRARQSGFIDAVAPVIDALRSRAQFRVSDDLLREVLQMVGE